MYITIIVFDMQVFFQVIFIFWKSFFSSYSFIIAFFL